MNSTAQKWEAILPEVTQLGCDKANICNQRSLPSSLVFILLPCVPHIKIVLFVIPLSLLAQLSYLATLVGNSFSLRFLHARLNVCQSERKAEEKFAACPVGVALIHRLCLPSFAAWLSHGGQGLRRSRRIQEAASDLRSLVPASRICFCCFVCSSCMSSS